MKTRPTSVTVIAWLLIITGGINLITTTVTLGNPNVTAIMSKSLLPIPVQYAVSYLGLFLSIVCGIALLKGCNWARYLYTVWGGIGLVIGILTSPMKLMMIPGVVLFLILVFFLFRSKATKYFSPMESANDTPGI